MAEAIAFPSLPPASPWDAYLLILIIPFILRLIFVMPPLIDLVNTYAPPGERTKHLKWFSERLRKLPIEGFWLIVVNEILCFLLPAIIAITARIWFGPIGWPSWAETPDIGVTLLLIAGAAWIITDFTKVTRSRRGIQLLAKYNLTTAKVAVQAAVMGHEILKGVGDIEIPRPWRDVIDVEHIVDGEHVPAPPNGPLQRIKHNLLDIVADFAETTIEQVRGPAGDVVDKFDEDIKRKITERVKASNHSLLNNVVFSIAPLLVLAGLQRLV